VDAEIEVSGGDTVSEVTDLREWLRGERGLAGLVRAVPAEPREGEMGGVTDVLAVALGSGGAGAVLARSLMAWLQTRRASIAVTVKTKTGTITVDAHNVGSSDALDALLQVLRDRGA
jgi:hypothetical protein